MIEVQIQSMSDTYFRDKAVDALKPAKRIYYGLQLQKHIPYAEFDYPSDHNILAQVSNRLNRVLEENGDIVIFNDYPQKWQAILIGNSYFFVKKFQDGKYGEQLVRNQEMFVDIRRTSSFDDFPRIVVASWNNGQKNRLNTIDLDINANSSQKTAILTRSQEQKYYFPEFIFDANSAPHYRIDTRKI